MTSKMRYVTLGVRDILLSSQCESQISTSFFKQSPVPTLTHLTLMTALWGGYYHSQCTD